MRLQVHICFIVRSRTQPQVNNINIEFLPLTLILRIFSQGSFSFKTLGRNQILLKLYIKRKIRGCGPCLDPTADPKSSRISSQVFALASPWPAWPWSSLPSWWHRSSASLQSLPPLETMLWLLLGEAWKLRLHTSDVYSIWSWGWASPTSDYVIHLLTLHFYMISDQVWSPTVNCSLPNLPGTKSCLSHSAFSSCFYFYLGMYLTNKGWNERAEDFAQILGDIGTISAWI